MSAAANAVVHAGSVIGLHQVLTEEMAERYGALALIRLPQDEDILLDFIEQMGALLSDKGIYRRDTVIVLADNEVPRLNIMEPEVFCSWAQRFVINFKITYNNNNEPRTSYKDMPTEVAKKTLLSPNFISHVPKIEEVFPIPMPVKDGSLRILPIGFDGGRFTFKF